MIRISSIGDERTGWESETEVRVLLVVRLAWMAQYWNQMRSLARLSFLRRDAIVIIILLDVDSLVSDCCVRNVGHYSRPWMYSARRISAHVS